MAIREYKCRKCGNVFEKLNPPEPIETHACPVCGNVADKIWSLTAKRRDMTVYLST